MAIRMFLFFLFRDAINLPWIVISCLFTKTQVLIVNINIYLYVLILRIHATFLKLKHIIIRLILSKTRSMKIEHIWLATTDKETDESKDIFIIWKINSGLVWAAGLVLWKKSLGPIMSNFWGPFLCFHRQKINLKFFLKIL